MYQQKGEGTPIEQYDHKGKERINNPPVGLVTPELDQDVGKKQYAYDPHIDPALQFDTRRSQIEGIIDSGLAAVSLDDAQAALQELKRRQAVYLNWAGKAERTSFEVPTVSLHVHERIDPRTIIETVRKKDERPYQQMSLFEEPSEYLPLREAIEFYKHKHNWSNRLIAGDSLLVMDSLLEKEGMGGQVQMVYIDPPYGIRYGSNFQPFINKKDVKDGKDEDLTQAPEMLKAFRDTWELGIHSYLAYLRDRLLLARELLGENGSVFVQISDENIHLVRCLLDEVFGTHNFCALIPFRKKAMPMGTVLLEQMDDYLLWYAKNKAFVKYRALFQEKNLEGDFNWRWYETSDGKRHEMTKEEIKNHKLLPKGARLFRLKSLEPSGPMENGMFNYEFDGKVYPYPKNGWATNLDGMKRLESSKRLYPFGTYLQYILYHDDYPITPLTNPWNDTTWSGFGDPKIYVVQTNTIVIKRCMLMTTDPGDLVFDPTCGSGTTAYVAEQWGRRWITCDTSRVAITLAKQRLMTALFDYYELAHPSEGVGSGFKYKEAPHITLGSIANNEVGKPIALYDQPLVDSSKLRVTGPFTVEAVPAPVVKPIDEIESEQPADESVARSGETLRQDEWRSELLRTGIRGRGGQKIEFTRVEPLPGTRYLQADAETKEDRPQRVVICFGPEHAPMEQRQVELAVEEAQKLVPKPDIIIFAAFQFDPEAAKDIDETNWPGVALLKTQMNADMLTEDLKKKRASNESFWLIGQPDILLKRIKKGEDKGKYQVEIQGVDYYNTKTGSIDSGGTEKIAMWMLDTDYDGRSLLPRQVFFPMAGDKDGWSRLKKNLKADIDPELIEAYRGTISLPFGPGKQIAVKIVDDRGIESLKIMGVE
jgi:adenine-specific DNA-methyltransferase